MSFTQEQEDIVYILVVINIHKGNNTDSGNYYCEILDFKTVTWWRCDYEKN